MPGCYTGEPTQTILVYQGLTHFESRVFRYEGTVMCVSDTVEFARLCHFDTFDTLDT